MRVSPPPDGSTASNHEVIQAQMECLGEDYLNTIHHILERGLQRHNPDLQFAAFQVDDMPTIEVLTRTPTGEVCDLRADFHLTVAARDGRGKDLTFKAALTFLAENLDHPYAQWVQSSVELDPIDAPSE